MYDIAIVGAGIIGSFLARDLSAYQLKVVVLEKESDVANVATMANSAIIHAGHDPEEGTLKAKFNLRGNRMYEGICKELGVSFLRTSAFVAAMNEEEERDLDLLYDRAKSRGIPVTYISREEALQKEPNLNHRIRKAIELPSTGVVYPWEVAIALMEEAVENGVELQLNYKVNAIQKQEEGFLLSNGEKEFHSKWVINAAGIYSDQIYKMVSHEIGFEITPRKGEYYVLDRLKEPFVSRVIYPLPSKAGKGVLAVPTTHGNVLLGPNSTLIEGKEEVDNTYEGLDLIKKELHKTLERIPMHQVIRNFSGIRPTGSLHDFIIEESKEVEHFINAACVESPGLASAPAISEYILSEILFQKERAQKKVQYKKRRPNVVLKHMTTEERNGYVKQNPAFGRVICRCEQITEGEILDAIHRPLGATTVKGVKKRARPGMGRCQGGFCEPFVVEILARELGCSPLDIRLDQAGSRMLTARTKGGASDETI